MTSDSAGASGGVRAAAAVTGLLLTATGGLTLFGAGAAFSGLSGGWASSDNALMFSNRDLLHVVVWAIFAASLVAAGLSLLHASVVARRHNLVPGPTLYVAGVSAVVIGFFLVAGGALLPAAVAVAVGAALMAAEYGSDIV